MQGCDSDVAETLRVASDHPEDKWIRVDISEQKLYLQSKDSVITQYRISTSKYGIGNKTNSYQTPVGWHRICSKIGIGEPSGMIFQSCKPVGRIAEVHTDSTDSIEDIITTRILRLEGLESGVNKGKGIDSYQRCIYIHGTNEEGLIGIPASHGCIRMKNKDVLDLFDRVSEEIRVFIDQ